MHSYPISASWDGQTPLTVAAVPTGRNAGVRISPRSVAIVPARAREPGSPAVTVKEIGNQASKSRDGPGILYSLIHPRRGLRSLCRLTKSHSRFLKPGPVL